MRHPPHSVLLVSDALSRRASRAPHILRTPPVVKPGNDASNCVNAAGVPAADNETQGVKSPLEP